MDFQSIDWNMIMTYYVCIHGAAWLLLITLVTVYGHMEFDFYGSEILLFFALIPVLGFITTLWGIVYLIAMIKKHRKRNSYN